MLQSKPITLIFGKICSGKSTFSDALCYVTKAKRITVSAIAKRLTGANNRSSLQSTKDLDDKIFDELVGEIYAYDKVVIDGIRQCSIVRKLVSLYGEDRVDQIWLEVPDEIRKYRFNDRMLSKDDSTFEQANEKDQQLGLGELQTKLKKSYSIIYN